MAILFFTGMHGRMSRTVECRARTWNRRIKQVRTTMFRIRPTGVYIYIYAAGSRVGNYPRHKTIPWNARHAAFRLAHFRYVITSILSQSRHRRVCPAIWRRVLRQIHGPLLHLPDQFRECGHRRLITRPFLVARNLLSAPSCIRFMRCFGDRLTSRDRLTLERLRFLRSRFKIGSKKDYFE